MPADGGMSTTQARRATRTALAHCDCEIASERHASTVERRVADDNDGLDDHSKRPGVFSAEVVRHALEIRRIGVFLSKFADFNTTRVVMLALEFMRSRRDESIESTG